MTTAKEHYEQHLGNFYSWMTGNFGLKQQEQETFFLQHGIKPFANHVALDLGAGHGLQSISLAKLGFSVTAVDFNSQLLEELRQKKQNLPIHIIQDEILHYLANATNKKVEIIVCMGDTLTHLENLEALEQLVTLIAAHVIPGGKVVLSFRDLTGELRNEERFIPVASDDNRILTCFLEYFPGHVMVHDILHEKTPQGWLQKISAYPKLRISANHVSDLLMKNRLRITATDVINRMFYLIAEKPI